jgi:hypothetical protein
MLAILNCQSEDINSYRRSKFDGGKGDRHLPSSCRHDWDRCRGHRCGPASELVPQLDPCDRVVGLELPRATAGSSVVNVTLWYPDEAHRRA